MQSNSCNLESKSRTTTTFISCQPHKWVYALAESGLVQPVSEGEADQFATRDS